MRLFLTAFGLPFAAANTCVGTPHVGPMQAKAVHVFQRLVLCNMKTSRQVPLFLWICLLLWCNMCIGKINLACLKWVGIRFWMESWHCHHIWLARSSDIARITRIAVAGCFQLQQSCSLWRVPGAISLRFPFLYMFATCEPLSPSAQFCPGTVQLSRSRQWLLRLQHVATMLLSKRLRSWPWEEIEATSIISRCIVPHQSWMLGVKIAVPLPGLGHNDPIRNLSKDQFQYGAARRFNVRQVESSESN